MLANLDPTLDRRPPPASALEALAAFPDGLTTAEVAALVRPSDLIDADPATAEEELLSLAAREDVERHPLGQDAIWRLSGQAPG